ncbi:MAG TPA: 3-phosphoglycerate dehydrogenase [Dehalococcoidia bacterium]|jgi:D-3-phosphoglycerate dehydrogenase|nr:3-phosphoglycerate dehydrogenase [Dehalococcoidia bacterium]
MAQDTIRALLLAPFHPQALERLQSLVAVSYESWMDTRKLLSPEELIARIEGESLQIVVVEADFIFEEVFQSTKKLRFVGVCRNAVNNVDVAAATEHGVLVVNTPARNAIAVAELTVGLMLSLARHLPAAHSLVKEGRWLDPVAPYISWRGTELAGKVAGIVGLGAIGAEVAKRLHAFDMEILVYDPYVASAKVAQAGARPAALPALMQAADFVTIHCPLTPETTGLIGAAEIALMKPTAYLINTASWEVVEEKALYQALIQRRIAGAAFDTFETHPVSPQSPFLKLDNVVLTPHLGGATDGTVARYSWMMVEDIERFLKGKRPKNLVNPEAWRGNAL